MYVVIFRARARELDATYGALAAQLRSIAQAEFGCRDFLSLSEGGQEITLSYWDDLAQIRAFKGQVDHLMAQRLGRERWYASYRVDVCEVQRSYGGGAP